MGKCINISRFTTSFKILYRIGSVAFAIAAIFASGALHADTHQQPTAPAQPNQAPSASGWELVRDKDDVKVWTRDIDGSKIKAFRGETEIATELNQVMALMDDTANYSSWMHQCKSPTLVRKVSPLERYTYMINDLPWPATNRDVLAHVKIAQDEQSRAVTVTMKNIDAIPPELAERLPPRKGLQALAKMEGQFQFIPDGENATKVIYEMHIELGGSLPAGIVNSAIIDTPFYTLKNMRTVALEPRYKHFKPF